MVWGGRGTDLKQHRRAITANREDLWVDSEVFPITTADVWEKSGREKRSRQTSDKGATGEGLKEKFDPIPVDLGWVRERRGGGRPFSCLWCGANAWQSHHTLRRRASSRSQCSGFLSTERGSRSWSRQRGDSFLERLGEEIPLRRRRCSQLHLAILAELDPEGSERRAAGLEEWWGHLTEGKTYPSGSLLKDAIDLTRSQGQSEKGAERGRTLSIFLMAMWWAHWYREGPVRTSKLLEGRKTCFFLCSPPGWGFVGPKFLLVAEASDLVSSMATSFFSSLSSSWGWGVKEASVSNSVKVITMSDPRERMRMKEPKQDSASSMDKKWEVGGEGEGGLTNVRWDPLARVVLVDCQLVDTTRLLFEATQIS
jgi:hypothetical protein